MNKVKEEVLELHDKLFAHRQELRPGLKYLSVSDFEGLKKANFSFKNKNGFQIRGGYYFNDVLDDDTLILFCHGYGGGHEAYLSEIAYLAKYGFKVLAIDYQGILNSDGDKMNAASQAVSDMNEAYNMIKDDYKHVYVVGHSWGGWVASSLVQLNKSIEKLVMLAGMESNGICFDRFFKGNKTLGRFYFLNIERKLFPNYVNLKARNIYKVKKLKALVIQSKDDSILDINKHLYLIRKKCKRNPNIQFLEVDGKIHNPTYTENAVNKLVLLLNKLDLTSDKKELKRIESETNWHSLCELDTGVMDLVVKFLK